MRPLQQLLADKPAPVTVSPIDTVFTALERLSTHGIGALPVLENGRLVGMFSERDYARKVVLKGKASRDTAVREVMSDRLSCVTLAQSVEECMALMTDKHVRHLPVIDASQDLIGILSIGDLVKEVISDQKFTIDQLVHYIHT